MKRRESLCALLTLGMVPAWRIALGQTRVFRIGVLGPRQRSILFPAVLTRLAQLGYVEGKNVIVEYRSADNVIERFPALARELIQAKCDLIFSVGSEHPVKALLELKATLPIVILAHDYDPLKAGVVTNLRQPGGNVTGMVNPEAEIATKRFEIMREILPKAKRFLTLADRFSGDQLEAVRQAAQRARVQMAAETFAAPPYDYEAVFARTRAVDAVVLLTSPVFADEGKKISDVLVKHRLPAASFGAVQDYPGYLIGYGIDAAKAYAPAGDIAVRILKGAKPAEIAVEQVTHFELAVNLKTARALNITIPQSVAVRADHAIR